MTKKKSYVVLIYTVLALIITTIFIFLNVSKAMTLKANLIIISLLTLGTMINVLYIYMKINAIEIKKVFDIIIDWIIFISVSIATILIVLTFFISTSRVSGASMLPTLKDNQMLFIRHFNYEPKNDDIVIVKNGSTLVVKRLIALPGDKIEFVSSDAYNLILYVNEDENPILDGNGDEYLISKSHNIFSEGVYELKDNEIFILGDNSKNSKDSKQDGYYDIENIIGKVVEIFNGK